jgi:hypothetical protein
MFTFRKERLAELSEIAQLTGKVFTALVCVKARQICCLPYAALTRLVDARKTAKEAAEDQYVVLVTIPANKSFRVCINKPGARNMMLGKPLVISRNDFPGVIFK